MGLFYGSFTNRIGPSYRRWKRYTRRVSGAVWHFSFPCHRAELKLLFPGRPLLPHWPGFSKWEWGGRAQDKWRANRHPTGLHSTHTDPELKVNKLWRTIPASRKTYTIHNFIILRIFLHLNCELAAVTLKYSWQSQQNCCETVRTRAQKTWDERKNGDFIKKVSETLGGRH